MDNEQLKIVYGLYKQATMGDNTSSRPGMLSGFEAQGKWDAWDAQKGKSKDEAAAEYVTFVKGLLGEWATVTTRHSTMWKKERRANFTLSIEQIFLTP